MADDTYTGQIVHGALFQRDVTINNGSSEPDPGDLSDDELTEALKYNAKLRERFRALASLPLLGRAGVTLLLVRASSEPLQASFEQTGGPWGAVTWLLACVVGPWLLYRAQLRDWQEEQLAVLALLKQRRAPLLIEKAHRRLAQESPLARLIRRLKR